MIKGIQYWKMKCLCWLKKIKIYKTYECYIFLFNPELTLQYDERTKEIIQFYK